MALPTEDTRRLLAHMAVYLGGVDVLATKLNVSRGLLTLYFTGQTPIPDALVNQIVDVLLKEIRPVGTALETPERDVPPKKPTNT